MGRAVIGCKLYCALWKYAPVTRLVHQLRRQNYRTQKHLLLYSHSLIDKCKDIDGAGLRTDTVILRNACPNPHVMQEASGFHSREMAQCVRER